MLSVPVVEQATSTVSQIADHFVCLCPYYPLLHFLDDLVMASSQFDSEMAEERHDRAEESVKGTLMLHGLSGLQSSEEATIELFDADSVSFDPSGGAIDLFSVRNDAASYDSGTILSSVASIAAETGIRLPFEDQPHDFWALSLNAIPTAGSTLSITTTESLYHDMISIGSPNTDDASVADSFLSLGPSMQECSSVAYASTSHSIFSDVGKVSDTDCALHIHDRAAFVNVADRLRVSAHPNHGIEWFSRFTEQDWMEFRSNAEMILRALETPRASSRMVLLPPEAPRGALFNSGGRDGVVESGDILPRAFICNLCNDLIVGATSLSCACPKSTICTQCWESHITVCEEQLSDGFIFVDQIWRCPFCDTLEMVTAISCHAIDVAVLHVVKALPANLAIKGRYYERLNAWRDEVIRRQSQLPRTECYQGNDQLLAELIQQEEKYLWNTKRRFWQTPLGHFLSELAIAIAAASIASVGLTVMTSRRS